MIGLPPRWQKPLVDLPIQWLQRYRGRCMATSIDGSCAPANCKSDFICRCQMASVLALLAKKRFDLYMSCRAYVVQDQLCTMHAYRPCVMPVLADSQPELCKCVWKCFVWFAVFVSSGCALTGLAKMSFAFLWGFYYLTLTSSPTHIAVSVKCIPFFSCRAQKEDPEARYSWCWWAFSWVEASSKCEEDWYASI